MANEGLTQVRNLWQTQLTADVSSSATTLPVVSTSGMPTTGIVVCGREVIYYTGLTGTSFTGCTRGLDSTATAHAKGGRVRSAPVAAHHNDLVTAIDINSFAAAVATGTTDPTTTSASAVALANPTITVTTHGRTVGVWARMTINCSVAAVINLYVRADGGAWQMIGDVSPPSSAGRQTVSGFHPFTGVGAGSHTFEMGWATSSGTATSYGGSRRLEILEV